MRTEFGFVKQNKKNFRDGWYVWEQNSMQVIPLKCTLKNSKFHIICTFTMINIKKNKFGIEGIGG